MPEKLLICTDLDRTLIPNGPQSESPGAREHFTLLAERPEVTLAYVSGRHRALVEKAIVNYCLPIPDFIIGDVGTTIYQVGPGQNWVRQEDWEDEISVDWVGYNHGDLKAMLGGIKELRLQERTKQNRHKLSYYVPLQSDRHRLSAEIRKRLENRGVKARLIWSSDEPVGIGLLDILPACASKYHAIEALIRMHGFDHGNTVFSGDSGNDIEVLASPISSVLVANHHREVRKLAQQRAAALGCEQQLYIAVGGFKGMNGNYSAGILEGIAHYHPDSLSWMGFDTAGQEASR